jgi:hypothetical protein
VLHEESSPQLLELIRRNWSVVINRDKGAIAPDDVCEKINLWTKLLPFTPYMDRLVKKTEHLSLARRCAIDIHDGVDVRSSKAPKRDDEYDRLFAFFDRCELFDAGNRCRDLSDNLFWEFVILNRESETNRTDKEKESVPLSAHKEELESVFFSMKESNAEIATVESILQEEEDDDDDEEPVDDEANEEDPIKTEEERRAALNKLSTVKKYKINPMALKDIDAEGRALLGDGLRDARLKQRADHQKFVAQIHEAVDHFKSEAAIRRENLRAILSNNDGNDADDTVSVCAWEEEYSDIIPED